MPVSEQRLQQSAQPVARQMVVAFDVIGQHLQRANVVLDLLFAQHRHHPPTAVWVAHVVAAAVAAGQEIAGQDVRVAVERSDAGAAIGSAQARSGRVGQAQVAAEHRRLQVVQHQRPAANITARGQS